MSKEISKPDNEQSIEEIFSRLDKLVSDLENPNASVGDSLRNFEQGINLLRSAQKIISDAEQKISILENQPGE